jgi:hypothetical protein
MGFISKITGIINGPYRYRQGPIGLGTGVRNLALVVPGLPQQAGPYHASNAVRRNMNVGFATFGNGAAPEGPMMSLRGNGLFLTGAWELSGLVDMSGGKAA